MTERKPPQEGWRSFVERKIIEAQDQGQFDALPGFGAPCDAIDEPITEDWWLKKKIKRERLSLLPPSLRIKYDIEQTLARVQNLPSDSLARHELMKLNDRIRQANYASSWGPASTVMEIDIELQLQRRRDRGEVQGR